jgi:uncharacterized SAM-binding protein YcdF (DUF218 family)
LSLFPNLFLQVQSTTNSADVIVVLGGEAMVRTDHALELFREKDAPRVIVSGHGDCESNKAELVQAGVPKAAIQTECDSLTTRENALNSIKLLRKQGAKRVILVTSWYHSRRALKTFQKFAPEITFISLPAPRRPTAWKYERGYVFSEYLKIIYYAFKWHVSPI